MVLLLSTADSFTYNGRLVVHRWPPACRCKSLLPSSATTFPSTTLCASHSDSSAVSNNGLDAQSIIEQARRVAFGDDAEYDTHYHPYKDEDEKLEQARHWLQQVLQVVSYRDDGVHVAEIVERLQQKVDRYERRIAKRKG